MYLSPPLSALRTDNKRPSPQSFRSVKDRCETRKLVEQCAKLQTFDTLSALGLNLIKFSLKIRITEKQECTSKVVFEKGVTVKLKLHIENQNYLGVVYEIYIRKIFIEIYQ